MKDIYVIYWSSTGNTEAMVQAVTEVSAVKPEWLKEEDRFTLGCPAMGAEELEEEEMEPFVAAIEQFVSGKTISLFGSYDWGDGSGCASGPIEWFVQEPI